MGEVNIDGPDYFKISGLDLNVLFLTFKKKKKKNIFSFFGSK
jgi:hypothetical protein